MATAAAPALSRASRAMDKPTSVPVDEAELVRKAQAGDIGAFEDLVRRHQPRVFAIIGGILRRSEDVEDVAQQVFLKVYLSLPRFDLRSTFSTWLYKVTVNECLDHLRKKKVRKLVYEADLSEEQAAVLEGAVQPERHEVSSERRAELRQLVDRLLNELPDEERLMMVLKEVEGWTVEEISEVLNLNVNTVKVRLFRARSRLVEFYRRRMSRSGGTQKRSVLRSATRTTGQAR
jgi:RNA polymerase sigma-70 factor (ECF subfamily)